MLAPHQITVILIVKSLETMHLTMLHRHPSTRNNLRLLKSALWKFDPIEDDTIDIGIEGAGPPCLGHRCLEGPSLPAADPSYPQDPASCLSPCEL